MILVGPRAHEFFILNRTATIIWSCLEQPATASEIAGEIRARFSTVSEAEALGDVEGTLRQLIDRGLATAV